MAIASRSVTGAFAPASGDGFPVRKNLRVSKAINDRLFALFPASGDQMDFIRAAIAEKLERDQVLSKQEI